jgi:hypothetical protein
MRWLEYLLPEVRIVGLANASLKEPFNWSRSALGLLRLEAPERVYSEGTVGRRVVGDLI